MKMAEQSSGPSTASNDEETDSKTPFICGVVEGFYGRPWTTEQRKSLFARMNQIGLNTYMYAPKDDFKHRAYWREPYSVEEAEQLRGLIEAAKEQGIIFYYALSPGLDITYSNPKEVACLKRKLEQVAQFGCPAFALLFDDIEPEISETDKEVFQSFAQAQVSITNEVYQSLGQPKFLFCPTEYCSARAVPNVQNSEYLKTIGSKLMQDIDIMWTGSKVISRYITVQLMQELSEVLRRPPLIWDNIHANDYDQKRIFLGPYSGRSPDLIPHLRGVLTNPNCEFEPNFIAIHTLAQWRKCKSDAKCELSSVSADIKLETESENGSVEDIPSHMSPTTYHPRKALKLAIQEWLPEFSKSKNATGKAVVTAPLAAIIPTLTHPPELLATDSPAASIISQSPSDHGMGVESSELSTPRGPTPVCESSFQPITKELVNSLVDPPVILNPLEPMDCNPSPSASPKPDALMEDTKGAVDALTSHPEAEINQKQGDSRSVDSAEEMQTEPLSESERLESDEECRLNAITVEDVSLLVDLFYLPFEHGNQGLQFLHEFQWLKGNSHLVADFRRRKTVEPETPEVVEWYEKAKKFEEMTHSVGRLLTRLTFCKNRSLLYDLYPYVWDVKGVICLLNAYVKWLALRRIPTTVTGFTSPTFTWFSKGYKEAFSSGEQEPWLFRGGITGELQRLLPVENVSDLFIYKAPESPSSRIYTIRPYIPTDEACVYEVCAKTCDEETREHCKRMPELLGDRLVGGYLCLSTELCFVVEDEMRVCGYVLAALDGQQFERKLDVAWFPDMCNKYPAPKEKMSRGEALTGCEQVVNSMHDRPGDHSLEFVFKNHPSIVIMSLLPHVLDSSVPKRLMACVLAALKANGSHGAFCRVTGRDKNTIDFYAKLGFLELPLPPDVAESLPLTVSQQLYLGRTI